MSKWNTTNVARACRAGLAGFALVILSASLAEATYGPRTKIGTNYQQTSTTTSENAINEGNCSGGNTCFVLFQVPPGQKSLIVQHVSCRLGVSPGTNLLYGWLQTRNGQDFPLRRTSFVPVPTADIWWVVNSPVMHLVKAGERPVVLFVNSAGANWSAECTISGKLQ